MLIMSSQASVEATVVTVFTADLMELNEKGLNDSIITLSL